MKEGNQRERRKSYRKGMSLLTTNDERDERTGERDNGKLKETNLKKQKTMGFSATFKYFALGKGKSNDYKKRRLRYRRLKRQKGRGNRSGYKKFKKA